jgi:hypothetical protein
MSKELWYTVKVIHDESQDCFIARMSGQRTIEGYGTTPGEALYDLSDRLDEFHFEREEDAE